MQRFRSATLSHQVGRDKSMSALPSIDLGPEEAIVARYTFRGSSALGRHAVLTSRRLVMLNESGRETHPLARIRSVRIVTGRSWLAMCASHSARLSIFAVAVAVASVLVTVSPQASAEHVREGVIGASLSAIFGVLCLAGAAWAHRGYATLTLELEADSRTYTVQRQDPDLLAFVAQVEHSL
jgi:hypothetical protein